MPAHQAGPGTPSRSVRAVSPIRSGRESQCVATLLIGKTGSRSLRALGELLLCQRPIVGNPREIRPLFIASRGPGNREKPENWSRLRKTAKGEEPGFDWDCSVAVGNEKNAGPAVYAGPTSDRQGAGLTPPPDRPGTLNQGTFSLNGGRRRSRGVTWVVTMEGTKPGVRGTGPPGPTELLDSTLVEGLGHESLGRAEHPVGRLDQSMTAEAGTTALPPQAHSPPCSSESPDHRTAPQPRRGSRRRGSPAR